MTLEPSTRTVALSAVAPPTKERAVRLLTPKQAAERGRVSRSLIYALLKSRRIPAMRVGCSGRGKWLIPEDEFDLFLQSCRVSDLPDDDGLRFIK